MKKSSIKNIIIALIIALSLIGTTVFICVVVLKDGEGTSNAEGGENGDNNENYGHIDDGGWTWD